MIKLYLRKDGQIVEYHEAWVHGSKLIEHWGILGEKGDTREHRCNKKISEEDNLHKILSLAIEKGFQPIDDEDQIVLLIEYNVQGMGTPTDLDKRHALEDRMNETLGWTGLGHCDGGSIGSGTMEVCCFVVDFEVAKRVIAEDLKNTEFDDYHRIYQESED